MRASLMAVAILVLAACSDQSASEVDDVSAMLQANNPEVCAADDVQRTVLETVDDGYGPYLKDGGPPMKFQAISATAVDASVHEVRCSANISFEATLLDVGGTDAPPPERTPVEYAVRPALGSEGGFVVSVTQNPILKFRLNAAIWRYQNRKDNQPSGQATSAETADGGASKPELGRCYQDSCSWSLTKSRSVVRQDASGTLVQLSLLGGTSDNTDGDVEKARIQWDTKPHDVYVFCSTRLPAVIMRNDAGQGAPSYQVDTLDFVNGVPGILESSANLFVQACYPGDDWTSSDFAQRRGLPALDNLPDITVDKPEDIFQAANSVQQH